MKNRRRGLWAFGLAALAIPQVARWVRKECSVKAMLDWKKEGMFDAVQILYEDEARIDGIYYSVVDRLPLSFSILKAERPEGLLQVVHGAQEHKGYYEDFAQKMAEAGFTTLLSDNRGHGDSVSTAHPRGFISSIDDIVIDQYALAVYFKRRFPGLSLAMFGHSFGSLIVRNFIMRHDDILDKLIMTGVVAYPPSAHFGLFVGNVEGFYTDEQKRGFFIRMMDHKTKAALHTVSNNADFLRAFKEDPLVIENYTNGGAMAIWEAAARLKDYGRYLVKNPNLEVLALNGTRDPLTAGAKGLADTAKTFYRLGYHNYENIVYPAMCHDLLHESASRYIFEDMQEFLQR